MQYARVAGCLVTGGLLAVAAARMGRDLNVTQSGGATQIHVALDTKVPYEVGQCYVDLMGVSSPWGAATHKESIDDSLVKNIRVGGHPDRIRIAIDLQKPAPCRVSEAPGGLVIEVGGKAVAPPPATRHTPLPPTSAGVRNRDATAHRPPHSDGVDSSAPVPGARSPVGPPPRQIDESAIQIDRNFELSIMEDRAQELPLVLQMYRGFFGFGEPGSRTLQLIFRAGDLAPMSDANTSIDNYFALQFNDNRSTLIADLRQKNQIPAASVAYALFQRSFRDVIDQQVRHAAAEAGNAGPIKAATIQFAMDDIHGIKVTSVK